MDFEATEVDDHEEDSRQLDKDEQNWGEACGGTSSSSSTAE